MTDAQLADWLRNFITENEEEVAMRDLLMLDVIAERLDPESTEGG